MQKPWRKQYHARLKLSMTSSTSTSSACLEARTCKPMGGYSVWAAVPPLPAAAAVGKAAAGAAARKGTASASRPIILVLAQMDSIDMFHDSIQVKVFLSCRSLPPWHLSPVTDVTAGMTDAPCAGCKLQQAPCRLV